MKKYILVGILSFCLNNTTGQTPNSIANSFGFHQSFHGTGDLKGFDVVVTKKHEMSQTFDWFYGSSLTFHFGNDRSYEYVNGGIPANVIAENAPLKFYTLGIQGESGVALKLFENKFPVHISTGPIIRYQSTSRPSKYVFTYRPTSNPDPYYTIKEIAPNTLSLGYKVQLEIGLLKIRKSRMFFNSYFQNDNRSDVITGFGLVIK
jgi:hypothetical protein